MRQNRAETQAENRNGSEPWVQFFRAVRRLAQQLDAQEAEADQEQNESQQNGKE